MNIFGNKVVLRALEPEDNALLLKLVNDPEIECMLGGASFPVSEYGQKKWYEAQGARNDILRCAIATKENVGNAVGTIILSDIDYRNGTAQIHIKIAKEAHGKGIGQDAIRTMVSYAFQEMRLHCVYAEILSYNVASQKMLDKCGFCCDGVQRERLFINGKYQDVKLYSVLSTK